VSIKLMNLAWDIKMSPTMKLVLLALCDWANDSGFCFPGMLTLANKACISKRQCQRIMSELISMALISVVGNQQGGMGSRRYQINVAGLRESDPNGGGDKLSPVAQVSPAPMTKKRKGNDTGVARTRSNHQADPPLQGASYSIDWSHTPQLSQKERVVVVDMLDGVPESQRQGIVDELAGALRAKAIKAQWPAWFRAVVRQAQAGAFVPNHALAIQRDRQRIAREAEDAEKRRAEQSRRLDPDARARGLAAMQAAIAEMGIAPKGTKSSN
jgi:hypothetical protein